MKRKSGRTARQAGFTLIELMVAVTGGLFVTIAVFALSKQTTSIYQAETRVGNATVASVVGFDRLRADLERAGYLISPNLSMDPKLCGVPDGSWPVSADGKGQYLKHLSSVFITPSTSIPAEIAANKLKPDEITLAGSYASVDQFPTGTIFDDTTNFIVTLQVASAPMARLGFDPTASATVQHTLLASVFGPGRGLRIVDTVGREQYAQIVDVDTTSLPPKIVLARPNSSALLFRGNSPTYKCGVQGLGIGSRVNVVNLIRYRIRDLSKDARYAALYDTSAVTASGSVAATLDTGRGELVREELDATGTPIQDANKADVLEVISEFAVDLAFGITVSEFVAGASATTEALRTISPGSTEIADFAGETWGGSHLVPGTKAPQYVRAVHARVGIRSREADRQAGMPTFTDGGGAPIMPGLYRFALGKAGFARVRTMQADVALRNHRGITW